MIYTIITLIIIAIDFYVKQWAATVLAKVQDIPVINNIFHLTYVENRGAAFGILKDARWVFISVSIMAILAIIILWRKYRPKSVFLRLGLSFVLGGAAGNLIDRVWLGFVIDMFNVKFINFPVFNVADIFICIGGGLVFLYFAFIQKEEK